jgi:hypothetical protein
MLRAMITPICISGRVELHFPHFGVFSVECEKFVVCPLRRIVVRT